MTHTKTVRLMYRNKASPGSACKVVCNVRVKGKRTPKQLHLGYIPLGDVIREVDRTKLEQALKAKWQVLFGNGDVRVDWIAEGTRWRERSRVDGAKAAVAVPEPIGPSENGVASEPSAGTTMRAIEPIVVPRSASTSHDRSGNPHAVDHASKAEGSPRLAGMIRGAEALAIDTQTAPVLRVFRRDQSELPLEILGILEDLAETDPAAIIAFLMVHYHGFRMVDVAEQMGCSTPVVSKRVRRCVWKIHDLLGR